MRPIDVRLVTYSGWPEGDPDSRFLLDALGDVGLRADVRVWSDPAVAWREAAVTVIRSTWDYHRDMAAFLRWTDHVSTRTRLCNPPSLVRWNAHKSYLLDLERNGLPVVPMRIVPGRARAEGATAHAAGRGGPDPGSLEAWAAGLGATEVVMKPAVSLDGEDIVRAGAGAAATRRALERLREKGDVIVQPFVASILRDGELSLAFIDGECTHAVRKRPAPGEYRVQERLGGTLHAEPAPPGEAALGRRLLAGLPVLPLYARLDFVEWQGALRITELELVEPSLFLRVAPGSAAVFANAIAARLPATPAGRLSARPGSRRP